MVFVSGSSTSQQSSHTSQFCIIWKSTDCTFCLLIWAIDEDTEQCLRSSPFVTVLISKHQLDIELLTLYFKLGILSNPAHLQSFHSAHTSSYYYIWQCFWKCVKSLTKVKLHCIHFPPFICMPNHFVIVGNQVGQSWFALGKSLLTFLDYCLVLYMLEIDSKRTCSTIFPRTKVRPTIV